MTSDEKLRLPQSRSEMLSMRQRRHYWIVSGCFGTMDYTPPACYNPTREEVNATGLLGKGGIYLFNRPEDEIYQPFF